MPHRGRMRSRSNSPSMRRMSAKFWYCEIPKCVSSVHVALVGNRSVGLTAPSKKLDTLKVGTLGGLGASATLTSFCGINGLDTYQNLKGFVRKTKKAPPIILRSFLESSIWASPGVGCWCLSFYLYPLLNRIFALHEVTYDCFCYLEDLPQNLDFDL